MATHDIFMPALSSTMTEGKIIEWLKQPGEKVGRGESVLVVESDKADMDVESFQDGFLAAILMPAGSNAPVGETIGLIVETEEEIASVQAESKEAQPQLNKVPSDQSAVNQKSEKESSPAAPVAAPAPIPAQTIDKTPTVRTATTVINDGKIIASPKAKKIASQLGVDLATVQGTGPHGRIQAEDVQRAQGQPVSVPWIAESNAPAPTAYSAPQKTKDFSSSKSNIEKPPVGKSFASPGETSAFNTLQQAVNRNMEASLTAPCFHVSYSIQTGKLDTLYQQVKPQGVTMTALLAKAVGKTLGRHPQVNAVYTKEGMRYPENINVAVAVAMEDGGLITPVLKDADKTDLFEMSRQWADLVKRSRSKQLQPDEYSTGTFTLSNLGMFGVNSFDAVLPPGTGAILAVAASIPTVAAGSDGSIAVKRQMNVNLTADHRVIYGADAALFLKDLAYLIEENSEALMS